MRLDKFLAEQNIGTRSQVKEYIKKGFVSVNDEIIRKPEHKLQELTDTVTFQGKQVAYQKYRYYMLHKPAGVVTATKDNLDKTVIDLLPKDISGNLFPVGRLDKDTEGLLLLTNDGELSHKLLSPKKHVTKVYYVECEGQITEEKLCCLQQGVDIGDATLTLPAKARLLESTEHTFCLLLTITEGRFHQVKRMIQKIDGKVTYLKRIAMGSLVLDEALQKGAFRMLTQEEIQALRAEP